MPQVASEPIEFPQHERVAGLQRLEAGEEARAGVVPAGGEILVDALGVNAGGEQRVALGSQRLGAVALRDPDIADEHGRRTTRKEPGKGASWRS